MVERAVNRITIGALPAGIALALLMPSCATRSNSGVAVASIGRGLSTHAGAVPQGAEACALHEALTHTPGTADKPLSEACAKAVNSDLLWRRAMVVLAAYSQKLEAVAIGCKSGNERATRGGSHRCSRRRLDRCGAWTGAGRTRRGYQARRSDGNEERKSGPRQDRKGRCSSREDRVHRPRRLSRRAGQKVRRDWDRAREETYGKNGPALRDHSTPARFACPSPCSTASSTPSRSGTSRDNRRTTSTRATTSQCFAPPTPSSKRQPAAGPRAKTRPT